MCFFLFLQVSDRNYFLVGFILPLILLSVGEIFTAPTFYFNHVWLNYIYSGGCAIGERLFEIELVSLGRELIFFFFFLGSWIAWVVFSFVLFPKSSFIFFLR